MEKLDTAQLNFKTTSLYLAAAILSGIGESRFLGCDTKEQIDGRKVFIISYPESSQKSIDDILRQFDHQALSVNLYAFSRKLKVLRSEIRGEGQPSG
ncbi:MAG: hypothetical protein PHC68_07200 [Syntrophorhabdaceae bacterium]|nr:hypothetical protein [Syntrophorhabdaceae bacterium]